MHHASGGGMIMAAIPASTVRPLAQAATRPSPAGPPFLCAILGTHPRA
jgi:hypothetical protein